MRPLLICRPEEGFSPTRDLRFDFFSNLFGRADKAFHSFLIPSEGWARFVSGHDFSRADEASLFPSRAGFSPRSGREEIASSK
jgi:hypothetical protein